MGKRTWVLSALVLTQACLFEPDLTPIELHAYRCSQAGQDTCQVPGDEIPAGTLPPLNEAFMVIAKYKGEASRWSLIYPSKNVPGLLDSMVWEYGWRRSPPAASARIGSPIAVGLVK